MFSILAVAFLACASPSAATFQTSSPIVSAGSGIWSDPSTWVGARVPGPGSQVWIKTGHTVTFDSQTDRPIRSIQIGGILRFDPDRDTKLDVGLIKIQSSSTFDESVVGCEMHDASPTHGTKAALEVGTPNHPISKDKKALIRLWVVDGLDPKECPAIVCCGGRLDLHGTHLSRTWVKLKKATRWKGERTVILDEPVDGWRKGDQLIVTAAIRQRIADEGPIPNLLEKPQTEERTIERVVDETTIELDAPLEFDHSLSDEYRAEVANLTRNVVVESADPEKGRGHTMYHKHSGGSISYAEFRHLGKSGQLGKYSLHFHRVADTMRGSSVIGASIWDSANRWITIHGSDYLVVRDCVGYRSLGHGFFLEDGTEMNNLLDRNLAVQAVRTEPLPGQVVDADRNDAAGFWWANSGNAFTRNIAAECDEYGFRFEAPKSVDFDPVQKLRVPVADSYTQDIRTVPFLKFESNESHTQRRYGMNLGGAPGKGSDTGGVAGVGPDSQHPFKIEKLTVWDSHWGLTLASPSVLMEDLTIAHSSFGLWHPIYNRHSYRRINFFQTRWSSYAEHGTRPDPNRFPEPLEPKDDRPPVTVILNLMREGPNRYLVQGVAYDDASIQSVRVNGVSARLSAGQPSSWDVSIRFVDSPLSLNAFAVDSSGNVENTHHLLEIDRVE